MILITSRIVSDVSDTTDLRLQKSFVLLYPYGYGHYSVLDVVDVSDVSDTIGGVYEVTFSDTFLRKPGRATHLIRTL